MAVSIKLADRCGELDALFLLRHRVFVEQEGLLIERPDKRIYDQFDAFSTTVNVIATMQGSVVGGLRVSRPGVMGLPADQFFDFGPHLPVDAFSGSMSMLCVDRASRKAARLTANMMAMGIYWAIGVGLTHVVAPVNPDIELLTRRVGFVPIGPSVVSEGHGLRVGRRVLPVVLDLTTKDDPFLSFVRRQEIDHFMSSFTRQFHSRGETVIHRGDPGDNAFVIVQGNVDVVSEGRGSDGGTTLIETLGPGEMFGELSLLTGHPRSASVVARNNVDLMVLTRDAFSTQLANDPVVAARLLEIVANRLMKKAASPLSSLPVTACTGTQLAGSTT